MSSLFPIPERITLVDIKGGGASFSLPKARADELLAEHGEVFEKVRSGPGASLTVGGDTYYLPLAKVPNTATLNKLIERATE